MWAGEREENSALGMSEVILQDSRTQECPYLSTEISPELRALVLLCWAAKSGEKLQKNKQGTTTGRHLIFNDHKNPSEELCDSGAKAVSFFTVDLAVSAPFRSRC